MKKILLNIFVNALLLLAAQSTYAEAISRETIKLIPLKVIGVSDETEKIFSNILLAELSSHFSINDSESKKLLSGSISKLGEKIIVMVMVKGEEDDSKIYFKEKVTVNDISELDIVAERIGQAIIHNKQFKDTITESNVTDEEVIPKPLKKSRQGLVFEMAAFEPIGGKNYGMGEKGAAFYPGIVIENTDYFIQTNLGYRRGSEDSYLEIPIDISIGKFSSNTGLSSFLSGGLGWRYLEEEVNVKSLSGGAIIKTVDYTFKNYDSGFGAHAKIGFVLMREGETRALLSLRYDVSDLKSLDQDRAQALGLQLGLMTF